MFPNDTTDIDSGIEGFSCKAISYKIHKLYPFQTILGLLEGRRKIMSLQSWDAETGIQTALYNLPGGTWVYGAVSVPRSLAYHSLPFL